MLSPPATHRVSTSPSRALTHGSRLPACVACAQAVTFLHVTMQRGLSPQQAALALVDEALSQESVTPPTRDNITLLLVQFAPMPGSAA